MPTLLPWVIYLTLAVAFSPAGNGPRAARHSGRAQSPTVLAAVDGPHEPIAAVPSRPDERSRSRAAAKRIARDASRLEHVHVAVPIDHPNDWSKAGRCESDDADVLPGAEPAAADATREVYRRLSAGIRGHDSERDGTVVQAGVSRLPALAEPLATIYAVTQEHLFFPARIDGRDYQLEAMLYRPVDSNQRPLVVFSHGRNGMYPARDPNMVNGYGELCRALAAEGHVVAYIVRRGYGNSEGPDTELQDTAVLSGLEGAKDYAAAVAYWRAQDFVRPDRVVLMGQSQGGWVVLACTNVPMDGVLGVVNISGGTNYRLMGSGAVTSAVQDHWVAGCSELGRHALVPSFWIYSENDQSISGPTARRMFDAFTAAGGAASMLMLPPYGTNGHGIVGQPDLFLDPLNDYLAAIGFGDEPYAPPAIGPVNGADAVVLGGTAVFTASVTGFPTPTRQWRKDGLNLIDGGDITGARTGTLRIARLEAADAGSYTLFAANAVGSAVSDPVVVQFPITAPSVSTQPQSQTVSSGASATFTVAVTGNPAPDYQWQRRPAGANAWENLATGGGYAGVTSATLTVSATTAMSGDQFRCLSTNSAGSIASSGAALTVNALVVMEPAPSGGGGGGGVESPWIVAALFLLAGARIATRRSMGRRAAGG